MKPTTELWATRLLVIILIAVSFLAAYALDRAHKRESFWRQQWEIKK